MMRNNICFIFVMMAIFLSGCVPLVVGSVAALGGYAVSKDTIQTDTSYDYRLLWEAAMEVASIRGSIKNQDINKGIIELQDGPNRVWIRIVRMSVSSTRLRISARRYHLPHIDLAQDIFVKIMERVR